MKSSSSVCYDISFFFLILSFLGFTFLKKFCSFIESRQLKVDVHLMTAGLVILAKHLNIGQYRANNVGRRQIESSKIWYFFPNWWLVNCITSICTNASQVWRSAKIFFFRWIAVSIRKEKSFLHWYNINYLLNYSYCSHKKKANHIFSVVSFFLKYIYI